MSSLAKAFVIGTMKADIAKVERDVWTGMRDTVCTDASVKKYREAHEASSRETAEECRVRYLATARRRLARYQQTGEIG